MRSFRFKKNNNENKININDHNIFVNNDKINIDQKEIIIPDCKVKKIIGHGSNAVLFKGTEKFTEREVAVKIWLSNLAKGKSNITRSIEEIKKLGKIGFDNARAIHIYRASQVHDFTYCVMEFINGITLKEYLSTGTAPLPERYHIAREILSGMQLCHDKGLFHGDLHEKNIMIDNEQHVRIIDFGTSHFSKQTTVQRDCEYMYNTMNMIFKKTEFENLLQKEFRIDLFNNAVATRIVLQYLVQVTILIEFAKKSVTTAKKSVTTNVIKDIASITSIVPFFDINEIIKKLFTSNDEYLELFNKTFTDQLFSKSDIYILEKQGTFEKSLSLYNESRKNFLNSTLNNKPTNKILSARQLALLRINLYSPNNENEALLEEMMFS